MSKSKRVKSSRFRNVLSGILLIMVMGILLAPDAMACHRGDPPKPHGKNATCGDDPNPNPGPEPTAVGTVLGFSGELVSDVAVQGAGRSCSPTGVFSADAGEYSCATDLLPLRINVRKKTTGVFPKKSREICQALDGTQTVNPSLNGFYYGWTDSCFEDSCAVEVRMVLEGQQVIDLSNGKSDLLDIVLHTSVDPSGDINVDSNPFFNSREMAITSIDLDFKKPGSSRSAARCTFYVTPYDPPVVLLISEPVD